MMDAMLKICLVAGEESGDQLGAKLMRALQARHGAVAFEGVGGHAMAGEGLRSLFPLADIAVMGITAVVARLPTILRRVYAHRGRHRGEPPGRRGHHRQPGFHPRRRQAGAATAARRSNHQLRQSERLGLAAGTRARRCAPTWITFWR